MTHAPYVGNTSCQRFCTYNQTQYLELAGCSLQEIHWRRGRILRRSTATEISRRKSRVIYSMNPRV
jgi:hypothetical protein